MVTGVEKSFLLESISNTAIHGNVGRLSFSHSVVFNPNSGTEPFIIFKNM